MMSDYLRNTNWLETRAERDARIRLAMVRRRAEWRRNAPRRPPLLLVAKNLVRVGYGVEDIHARTFLPLAVCRRLVFCWGRR